MLALPKFGVMPKSHPALPANPMGASSWLHTYLRNKVRSSSIGVKPGAELGLVPRPRGLPVIPPHATSPFVPKAPGLFTPPS